MHGPKTEVPSVLPPRWCPADQQSREAWSLPIKFQIPEQRMPVHPTNFGQVWSLQFPSPSDAANARVASRGGRVSPQPDDRHSCSLPGSIECRLRVEAVRIPRPAAVSGHFSRSALEPAAVGIRLGIELEEVR